MRGPGHRGQSGGRAAGQHGQVRWGSFGWEHAPPGRVRITQKLRSSPANSRVPIVMLTGDGDAETMRKAFKAGITFFLSKPVSLERLSGLVRVMRGPML